MIDEYEIKIAGSGSLRRLIESLQNVVDEMSFIEDAGGPKANIEWEDPFLVVEINKRGK